LSHHACHARISIDAEMLVLMWCAGAWLTKSNFGERFCDGFEKKPDGDVGLEFGEERKLTENIYVNLHSKKS